MPPELQKELIEKAAAKYGNCQELAKHLNIPKSSVHYYRIGRLTMPVSVLEELLKIANDDALSEKIELRGITKDRSWATEYATDIFREMCREKVRLPTRDELVRNDGLRRDAAAIVSYVLAEGSVWLQKERFGEHAANITFAEHEVDLFVHFRSLCKRVFDYDLGNPQFPGNGAHAIRGFIYSRFVAEWLVHNGVPVGDKAANQSHMPDWVMQSSDRRTLISALQPWCDGEGSVGIDQYGRPRQFSITQSHHTDLDFECPRHNLGWRGDSREVSSGAFENMVAHGIPLRAYLEAFARSEVLDDVYALFKRVGLLPKMKISSIYLKDNGFWSSNWTISLRKEDALRLDDLGLVTQGRKIARLRA